jgi:hypothetical protein
MKLLFLPPVTVGAFF